MNKVLRIGTRDSQLAVWQATLVQSQLLQQGITTELVYIKSTGDIDLVTPLYEIGVQGIFTKTLDAALVNNRIDIAVHSMKDVPTQLAQGLIQAAVLMRASYKDIFVYKNSAVIHAWELNNLQISSPSAAGGAIATSSTRRKAQWLHRYPHHKIENLRVNVNTRLRKLTESGWDGAIFAAAGLERIGLRPEKSVELDWMLPAPAQGAIMIVCREEDTAAKDICVLLNDTTTALCTKIERDFLRTLFGGCSTPISALAELKEGTVFFQGNILSPDGKDKMESAMNVPLLQSAALGIQAAKKLLEEGADKIVAAIRDAGK